MKKSTTLPPPPEPRTIPITTKVQKSVDAALTKAAKANGRTRSTMVQAIIEVWLKDEGFLK